MEDAMYLLIWMTGFLTVLTVGGWLADYMMGAE